jgi:hypothetical protein
VKSSLEHDPEKCVAVFRKDHAQTKGIERDDDSKKSQREEKSAITGKAVQGDGQQFPPDPCCGAKACTGAYDGR